MTSAAEPGSGGAGERGSGGDGGNARDAGLDLDGGGGPCVACGAPLSGDYCAACGEQRPRPGDLTLRHAITESFDVLDSRAVRTFGALVRRPGRLTADYAAGRRRAWLTPFQTFIIANVIFFAAAGLGLPVVTLTTPLDVHVHMSPYDQFARTNVRAALELEDASWPDVLRTPEYERLQLLFDNNARHAANSLIIIFVPLFALALALLRAARREPAGHHLAFTFHYLAFALLLFVAASVVLLILHMLLGPRIIAGDSFIIPVVILSLLALYLFRAFRTAYRSRTATAAMQAAVMAFLFLPLIAFYRFVLFNLVLRSL